MKHIFTYLKMCYLDNLMKNIGIAILIFLAAYHGDLIMQQMHQYAGFRPSLSPYFFIFVFIWNKRVPDLRITQNFTYIFAQSVREQFIFRLVDTNKYSLLALMICIIALPFQNDIDNKLYGITMYFIFCAELIVLSDLIQNKKNSKRTSKWTTVDTVFVYFTYFVMLIVGVFITVWITALLAPSDEFDLYVRIVGFGSVSLIYLILLIKYLYKSFINRTQYLTN